MKFKALNLLCCFVILQTDLFSQIATQMPQITPASPNVTAMQRYGDIPVGHYTGTPNINIPLYEIKSDDITIPISISYHSSGIKVADESSRVGLGWVLDAGGVISRQVVGADDFAQTGYQYHNTGIPEIVNGPAWNSGPLFYLQKGCDLSIAGLPTNANDFIRDGYDFQPDKYYFNLGMKAGRFILKRNRDVVLESKEKIRVVCSDNVGSSWEITTEDGTVYLFDKIETYTGYYDPLIQGPSGQIKSAWYLTKITSPKGAVVDFVYTTVLNNYIKPMGSYTQTDNPHVFTTGNFACGTLSPQGPSSRLTPGKEYTTILLDKILFNSGEVKFLYSNDRQDVIGDYRLTKVQIFRKTYNPSSSVLFKEWQFTQNYFRGEGDQDYTEGSLNYMANRLRLASIKEFDASGNSLQPYVFTYNNDGTLASSLPAKTSFARDHWGYYNGKVSNTSLIPEYNIVQSSDVAKYYLGTMKDNRDVDPYYSQLFILKEIKYPTGGKTSFDFESNDFDYAESDKYDRSYNKRITETEQKRLTLFYPCNIVGIQPTSSQLVEKTLDLTDLVVGDIGTASVTFDSYWFYSNTETNCLRTSSAGIITYELVKENGTSIEGPIDPIYSNFVTCDPAPGDGYRGFKIIRQYNLQPGKYIWKLSINSSNNGLHTVSLNVDYTGLAAKGIGFAGGTRIKRISTFDNTTNTPPIVRTFEYKMEYGDASFKSSGIRMAKPAYSYFNVGLRSTPCSELLDQFLFRESDSHTLTNGSKGGIVGYSKVSELIGNSGEFGKTEYFFDNQGQIILPYTLFYPIGDFGSFDLVFQPPPNSAIEYSGNGNLLNRIDYKWDGSNYVRVAETINTYTDFIGANPAWYAIDKRLGIGAIATHGSCGVYYNLVYPAIVENRRLLTSTRSLKYDQNNPSQSINSYIEYEYDHATHLQLKKKKEFISNGKILITEFTYPGDYSDVNAGSLVTEMKSTRWMHNSKITSKSILESSGSSNLIGGAINRFQQKNGKIVNLEVAVLEIDQPVTTSSIPNYLPSSGDVYPANYSAKVLFESFDISNNITQVRKVDDVASVYIWDYNKSYPIAEVRNAVESNVAYTSFEADGSGNWTVPSNTRNTTYAITGGKSYSLSSGNISKSGLNSELKYVISYWSRSGAITVSGGTVVSKMGRSVNGWTYFEAEVTMSGTTLTLSGSAIIDELRLFTSGSLMKTYTYSPLLGLTSQVDETNHIQYFEYDGFGRLVVVKDQDFNIIKTFEYKYKN